uniref:Alfy-like armadillo-like repeat domain-containing protein n=1 Tax=Hippocampus comes TaxID=109280 RepID=A0A3Q2Z7R3_HIPCM
MNILHMRFTMSFSPSSLGKNCIRICIQNLSRINSEVAGPLLAEVAVAVFSFIRDTYPLNPALFIEFDSHNDHDHETFFFLDSQLFISGSSVKNVPAFHLLQTTLLQSEDSLLCCQILRTIQMIWELDKANFFLLEWTFQTMAQLAACVCHKPAAVHTMFYSMLEMVIFKLNYIPHEALRVVLGILKQSWSGLLPVVGTQFGVATLTSFHSGMFAEVLSDWGLLELLLGELRRRAKIIRKAGVVTSPQLEFYFTTFFLTHPLCQLFAYVSVSVRELGMVPYIKLFLDEAQYRDATLCILEHLAELNPEEFMSTAIGALCSSTQHELALKRDLLQSILKVLESPNSLDAFRRAGGFTGLLSLVLDMDGALADPPQGEVWRSVGHQPLLDLLLLALHILASAVHLHAVNAHFFQTGGFYEKLAEALLQLGCFHSERSRWEADEGCFIKSAEDHQPPGRSFDQFVELAQGATSCHSSSSDKLSVTLRTCIRLLSYLDHFATGLFSPLDLNFGLELGNSCDGDGKMNSLSSPVPMRPVQQSMEEPRFTCDHVILHPGAIRVIVTLLPFIFTPEDIQLSVEIQLAVANHIQSAVKSERNRQIMCEGGLLSTLLTHCHSMLLTPNDPLHLTVTRILEKLSSQAITPLKPDFFFFLPDLTTKADPTIGSSSKTLKRNFSLLQSTNSSKCFAGSTIPAHQIISVVSMTSPRAFRPHRLSTTPAFVEFDMSESGHGCLFLPSLATVKGVTADSISTGGIGGDCRSFPPTAGLSFSCWFQINRFSSACDSHPIRLLTVVRHMSRTEQQYICLSISFSAYDGCLVLSTEEEAFTYLDMMEPEVSTPTSLPNSLKFRCSSLLIPGQWHHLVVVMAKDVKKSCVASAYFNGKVLGTGKMKYIQPFPGKCVYMDPTAVIDVYALIGTPTLWKDHAALVWRIGPAYLFEKALSAQFVGVIYSQGTVYLGNFLALYPETESFPLPLVPEERITFGINPAVSTLTNVVRIRENYNEVDCRLIAKELGITSRDQSTPVFLAHNISHHLNGTARTIGAALIGHFGVRTFVPRSAADGFLYVGGPAVVLSLIAMAADDSSLYAAVKVLLSVLETNSAMQQEMNRICGYKLLAFLLKMKKTLVSHRTFQLILYLSSSMELSCGPDFLQNTAAFQALLLDLEVWRNTSENLDLSFPRSFSMLPNITAIIESICSRDNNRCHTLLLCKTKTGWNQICHNVMEETFTCAVLCFLSQQNAVYDTLGSDWFLHFLKPHLHSSTVKLGLILITHFLSCPTQQSSFREVVLLGSLINDNLRAHSWSYECSSAACPGFDVLQSLLVRHFQLPQVYEALAALLLGRRVMHSAEIEVRILDLKWDRLHQVDSPAPQLCMEAATILLELVKIVITQHRRSIDASWELQLLASVMQFFCLLHNLRPRDPLWASIEFLHALVAVMFPWYSAEDELRIQSPKKPVCDFIHILLMDSLLNVSGNNNTHPLVILVEFCPDGASLEQRQSFQTEMLKFMMDVIYMLSNDNDSYTHLISQGNVAI